MKNISNCFILIIFLASCARMPYDQWNSKLTTIETDISHQVSVSEEISSPDVFLFKGVYNATRNKEASPYPLLRKNSESIEAFNKRIKTQSENWLEVLTSYRLAHAQKSISTIGPQWTDYENLLISLQNQRKANEMDISQLNEADITFDSICIANKIKAIPMLDFEVKLAAEMTVIEDDFDSLRSQYDSFKKNITSRADAKESLVAINRMKQKIRQIENELHQYANIYSRISSLRADAMLFEGPFIDPMAEIKLVNQKTEKINGLLSELRGFTKSY